MAQGRNYLLFKIDAYTPDTIPMARLGEYLSALAAMYGSRESVHFEKLLKGSAVLRTWVEATEAPRVIQRVRSAPTSEASDDVRRAYARIDAMLRENNAVGEIKRGDGTKILAFPGRKLPDPKPVVVTESAEVDGVVVRVGGTDETIPVHLQGPDGTILPCHVRRRDLAREMAVLLYGAPIRARGPGQWERTVDGLWKLREMTIEGWEVLDSQPLTELFARLRANPGNGWKAIKDPEDELRRIRNGG